MDRVPTPGELLDPRREVVPFQGRADELDALARWRDGEEPRSVLLLHGPAGVGKTRLARHFAGTSAVRVVDDADLMPWRNLHQLLQEATDRVLLVARTAGWWWSSVRQRAGDSGYRNAELVVGPDRHGPSFATACAAFADALGRPLPTTPAPDAASRFAEVPAEGDPCFDLAGWDRQFGSAEGGPVDNYGPVDNCHDVHLAALAAVCGSPADDPADLVRWLVSVDPNPPTSRLAEDFLAVTLLDDRIAPDRTPHALETLLRAADRWPHVRRRAEELFTAHPHLAATATAATLRALTSPASVRAVARRVFDDPRFHRDPLPAMLTRVLLHDRAHLRDQAGTASTLELAELHGALSARAALAALREEALEAARHEVALYRQLAEDDPAEHSPALADALTDLGLRLIALGRTEEAVAVSEEAVALCRVVAAEDDDWTPQLAGALDRLSLRYAALGRRDEASAAIAEACVLYRESAARNPALFGRDLARATHHQFLVSLW
ncbi:hypothetical protein ALI22I_27845 [Saccharothrix sp. ALI-22-I]|uniref:hypothetical protein n=1 Tax=Saccharothrix sp. ALI-22-I TaxID=1933778 RepID=UPI00097C6B9B|nr:hypothetical protein [Saccharothrix sp. ALI-22-I]ONI85594.1 hypothetical protein ALI22I_27845 [Saccharothrix sp. ALI-22-I]